MKCRGCGGKSDVVDSRPAGDLSVWRRRKCRECKATWITWETPDGVDDESRSNMVRMLDEARVTINTAIQELMRKGRKPR